ncbi:TPA: hypothetical protein LTU78_002550, partial [Listeria monocytogenes]|nr:hypothetical protein [Listeria monocytogenes]
MNISDERESIYHLMQEIMTERRQLTKQYFDLKERLNKINLTTIKVIEEQKPQKKSQSQIRKENIENDKYFLSKKEGKTYLP